MQRAITKNIFLNFHVILIGIALLQNFIMTQGRGGGGGGGSAGRIFATSDLLNPTPLNPPSGSDTGIRSKSRLICFLFIVPLSSCEISVKISTNELLRNLNI